ncbi:MAG: hypothetical protein LBN28_02390 [Desulfovibrio sp.]|jgi:hypothetical protein|nr:hypothetical protein [Desulfovibrio sp.]
MAKPIEPTPALQGEAAKNFLETAKNPKPYVQRRFDIKKMNLHIKKVLEKSAPK